MNIGISIGMSSLGNSSGALGGATPDPLNFRAVATNGGSVGAGGTLDVDKPTGTVDGDMMLLAVSSATSNASTAPAGWTQVADITQTTDNNRLTVWYKVAASEGANYTITTSLFNTIHAGIISWYSTSARDIIVDVSATGETDPASTNHVAPSVTTTKDNAELHCFYTVHSSVAGTPHAGMTERWEGAGAACAYLMTDTADTAGATGARTMTGASLTSAAITVAIVEDV